MTDIISYSGWIGHNNIGDEALYVANKKIFNEFELVNKEFYSGSDVILYGGGTVVPHSTHDEYDREKLVAAIGVGVKDPDFRNRPFVPIDISYYLGRAGASGILENRYIRHGLRRLAWKFKSVALHDKYIDETWFRSVRNIDYLGVRGPKSKEVLERYDITSRVVGDTALILEPTNYQYQSTQRVAITLKATGRDLKWTENEEYVEIIKSFCRSHSDEYEFVFIPFRPVDIPLHIELVNEVENAQFKDYCSHVDVQAAIDELANCDLVIGERLHANILAACSHTPFISVGYQPKNADFATSLGLSDYNIRIDHLTLSWLENRATRALTTDDYISKLKNETSSKRGRIQSLADEVVEAIAVRTQD